MAKYEITAEMNLKTIITESREVAQALLDFADRLTEIGKKYSDDAEWDSEYYGEDC